MNEIQILKDLVKFDTIKDKENKEILDYIQNYFQNLGFKLEKREKYLIMSYGENCNIGFIGHSDTVEFIDGWKTNPHELTQIGDMLYGLGSCDMKGGIAAFMQAVSEINLKELKKGIKVYITYDEEIGFGGINELVYIKEKMPKYLIIGEPTDNKIMTGCKGLFAVKIFTKGIKVHSSTPHRGKSANTSMIRLLAELEDFYNENIKNNLDKKYEVPYTTMNIGLLNGGSAINSVAAECMSYVDFRIIDNEHIEILKEKLQELSIKYDANFLIDVEVKSFYNDIEFLDDTYTAGFMTEASFVEGNRMIIGPCPMTAHEVDEHVSISSLRGTVEIYKTLINQVCK